MDCKLIIQKELKGLFSLYYIVNREIMNEKFHYFYIDSLEVFAILK